MSDDQHQTISTRQAASDNRSMEPPQKRVTAQGYAKRAAQSNKVRPIRTAFAFVCYPAAQVVDLTAAPAHTSDHWCVAGETQGTRRCQAAIRFTDFNNGLSP